tara:strand:+ start:332 stop:559 length:228 start_codon:yes stop_codon:yes gene_type:complete
MSIGDIGIGFLIFGLIVCILNIILFFKVWGMTNNVKLLTKVVLWKSGLELHKDRSKGAGAKTEIRTLDGETIGTL